MFELNYLHEIGEVVFEVIVFKDHFLFTKILWSLFDFALGDEVS